MINNLIYAGLVALSLVLLGGLIHRFKARLGVVAGLSYLLYLQAVGPLYLCGYIVFYTLASPTAEQSFQVSSGIEYKRHFVQVVDQKAVVHVAKLDLDRVRLQLTGPLPGAANVAMRTTDALQTHDANLAVNGSFFDPFKDAHLFDYYPHAGDPVSPVGQTQSAGVSYGVKEPDWPKLLVDEAGAVSFVDGKLDVTQLRAYPIIISGRSRLVSGGVVTAEDSPRHYSRTVVGLSADKRTLWLVVVDGRQPGYSTGLTLMTVAEFLSELGAHDVIELDGGGSATMAWLNKTGKAALLSRPSHSRLPNKERPVANHLLVFSRSG